MNVWVTIYLKAGFITPNYPKEMRHWIRTKSMVLKSRKGVVRIWLPGYKTQGQSSNLYGGHYCVLSEAMGNAFSSIYKYLPTYTLHRGTNPSAGKWEILILLDFPFWGFNSSKAYPSYFHNYLKQSLYMINVIHKLQVVKLNGSPSGIEIQWCLRNPGG